MLLVTLEWKMSQVCEEVPLTIFWTPHMVGQAPRQADS